MRGSLLLIIFLKKTLSVISLMKTIRVHYFFTIVVIKGSLYIVNSTRVVCDVGDFEMENFSKQNSIYFT